MQVPVSAASHRRSRDLRLLFPHQVYFFNNILVNSRLIPKNKALNKYRLCNDSLNVVLGKKLSLGLEFSSPVQNTAYILKIKQVFFLSFLMQYYYHELQPDALLKAFHFLYCLRFTHKISFFWLEALKTLMVLTQ